MGCGSSSTSVQPFKDPDENKQYRIQKAPSRQSSAAPSIQSQRSERGEKIKRKSSASSSSSTSTRQRKSNEGSRIKSASTRQNSDINDNQLPIKGFNDENETKEHVTETNVANFQKVTEDYEELEKRLEAKRHHEEIQKQTFLTGDPEHEKRNENKEVNNAPNIENHDEIARQKEQKRLQFDYEKVEDEHINSHGPVPLAFPAEMDAVENKNAEYTVDDIVEHKNKVADLDWFKYGKKIYSWKKMKPIIQGRVDQFKDIGPMNYYSPTPGSQFGYPIFVARDHGITRKELVKVLSYCHVGNSIEVPREQYLARMKQSAENVLEEDTGTDYFKDYKDQLNRWLADYPMNKVYNDPPNPNTDPNEVTYPLPTDIQADPSVLRKWIETWIVFDCEVPEEGAWSSVALIKDDWGDTHELYANQIKELRSEEIEPFDMAVDGDVAWIEIELDLFKNDRTTEHQETVWKKRATRTNLEDPVWMKKRREELANLLKKRYEEKQKAYPVENFMNFAEILERHWEEFQTLCQKEFIPPVRKERQPPELKDYTNNNANIDGGEIIERADNADNRLPINHESDVESHHSDVNSHHSPENNARPESGSSSRDVLRIEHVGSSNSNRSKGENGDNADKQLVINHDHRENTGDGINNVDDVGDQILTLETTDSGLDLESNDQLENEKGNIENRTNGDSIQITNRPASAGSGKSGSQKHDDFFD